MARRRSEYAVGPIGPGSVRETLETAVGKTIAGIAFGPEPSDDDDVHDSEFLEFHFTDGSILALDIGSNAGQLMDDVWDGKGRRVKASDLSLSFIALTRRKNDA